MRKFDNQEFTEWIVDFEEMLVEAGIHPPQAMRYRSMYLSEALKYFMEEVSPSEAVVNELLL